MPNPPPILSASPEIGAANSDLRQRPYFSNAIPSSSSGASGSFLGPASPESITKTDQTPMLSRSGTAPTDSRERKEGRSGHGKERSTDTYESGNKSFFSNGAHRKPIHRAPWITTPVKGTEEVWIERDKEAVEWLSLFYDLVVVAVLSIFSTQHELANPEAIPTFLSFFVIIFWVWVSQTAYDMRYQGNDALNRFFKFIQISLFIYQGAASGNWNAGRINTFADDDPYGQRTTQHQDALQSFVTVVLAFAVSRAFLALQYGICWFQGRRASRQTHHIATNVFALLASMILAIISVALPSTSQAWKVAKLVLFYSGIGVEVANVFAAVLLGIDLPIETHKVAERYGAFTLIILGEGIIGVARAFSRAISGLSNDDSGTYVQVFLTILIIFLLYSFLFGTFDKNDETGHGRAIIWQILHFPLCFGMLLLVAAMVNVVVTLSAAHGTTLVLSLLDPYSAAVANGTGAALDTAQLASASKYMNKLSLEPPFVQTITGIYELLNDTTPATDPQVVYLQYAAQITYTAFQLYGTEIPVDATNMYLSLYSLNTTWQTDATERAHIRNEASHMLNEIVQEILNDSFTGILWLLPVSGCVLILTACRSMLWYRFVGAAHWIFHGSQLIAGVILALLGLLDIGSKHLDIEVLAEDNGENTVNPLYRILFHEVPLVIIGVVYLVVYLGSGAAIWFLQRRQEKRDRGKNTEMIVTEPESGLGVEVDSEAHQMQERR